MKLTIILLLVVFSAVMVRGQAQAPKAPAPKAPAETLTAEKSGAEKSPAAKYFPMLSCSIRTAGSCAFTRTC